MDRTEDSRQVSSCIQPPLSTIAEAYFDRYRYPEWLRTHSRAVGALAARLLPAPAALSGPHPVYAPRDPASAPRTLAEKIVYYADRRVGQRVVSLEERIGEQLARFPGLAALRDSDLALAKAIEAEVFRGIALRPEELS